MVASGSSITNTDGLGRWYTAASSPKAREVPSDMLNDSNFNRFFCPHCCVNSRVNFLPCLIGWTFFVLGTMVVSNSPIRSKSSGELWLISYKTLAALLPSAFRPIPLSVSCSSRSFAGSIE